MTKPTKWYWVIAGIFLLWNIIGCYLYIVDVTMSDARYAEAFGDEMASVRHLYPTWAIAAFAVAVWGGLAAAGLLLLRRALSVPAFLVSLLAAVICFIPIFTKAPMREASGSTFWVMPLIVVVIGLVQVWYARRKKADGILN